MPKPQDSENDAYETEKWKEACELLGKEIGERLSIFVKPLRENYKAGAAPPGITLKMEPAQAGEMPLVTIKLSIPKVGLKDESEFDLNQLRLFSGASAGDEETE